MGGFFSFFSPPPEPPPPPPPPPPPVVTATPDPEEENRKSRLAVVARNRSGLAGTIATSERGVLAPASMASSGAPLRKTLLGE
jgi:hypothetical protein